METIFEQCHSMKHQCYNMHYFLTRRMTRRRMKVDSDVIQGTGVIPRCPSPHSMYFVNDGGNIRSGIEWSRVGRGREGLSLPEVPISVCAD